MFQLTNIKDKFDYSQPPKDLSMELNHQSESHPNSENEFLPENEEHENNWSQPNEDEQPFDVVESQDPINFYLHNEIPTGNDYSDDDEPIKSMNIHLTQTNSPKIYKPIHEKDLTTYPMSADIHFLSDTDEEVIIPSQLLLKTKNQLLLQTSHLKEREEDPTKMNPIRNNFLHQKLKLKKKKTKSHCKEESKMNWRENKSPKTY
jgi:hypothetical protein